MRSLIAALFFCLSFFALSPAYAGFASDYGRDYYSSHVRGARAERFVGHRFAVARNEGNGGIRRAVANVAAGLNVSIRDAAYWLATRQGGPCGLTTERLVFGRSDHVLDGWNPWLARAWLRFARASPQSGMVAVWRNGRHVEVVARDNGDGTIATRGSVGFARVSLREVIVVDPHVTRGRFARI